MTIREVSKLTGVSVRTLHHYDAIRLLPPTRPTDAGYRLYDDTALARLQSILLFRELEFPLKEIKRILMIPASTSPPLWQTRSNCWSCGGNSLKNSSPLPVRL